MVYLHMDQDFQDATGLQLAWLKDYYVQLLPKLNNQTITIHSRREL